MLEETDLASKFHLLSRDDKIPVILAVQMKAGKDLFPSIPLRLVSQNPGKVALVFAVIEKGHENGILSSLVRGEVAVCNFHRKQSATPVSLNDPSQHHERSLSR